MTVRKSIIGLLIGALALACVLVINASPASAAYNVQSAINAAPAYGTVSIPAGTYYGPFYVNKPITLKGTASTILTASGDTILSLSGSGIKVDGLTIKGVYSRTTQVGIRLQGVKNSTINNVTIKDVGFSGIFGTGTDTIVQNSRITHCGDFGIQFKSGSLRPIVRNNYLNNFASRLYPGHGVYMEGVTNPTVTKNFIEHVAFGRGSEVSGIKITQGSGGTVSYNTVRYSYAGISLPAAANVHVFGNNLYSLDKRGIFMLAGAHDLLIENNRISKTPQGFAFDSFSSYPTRVTIRSNTLTSVTTPLYKSGSVSGLTLSSNIW